MSEFISALETFMNSVLSELPRSRVRDAMEYALMGQGKRLRPLMVYTASMLPPDHPDVLKVACALEMVHTYSLIHDDLPAMDNDDYRRGRLTTHKMFDEATAILAGDALLTHSFELIADTDIDDARKVILVRLLAQASGARGMVLGQDQDMDQSDDNRSLESIFDLYANKTGALFACALSMGAVLANHLEYVERFADIGRSIGIVFQVQDDYLERTSDFATLGKSTDSDQNNFKRTAVELMGLDGSRHYVDETFKLIVRDIMLINASYNDLISLILAMKERRK